MGNHFTIFYLDILWDKDGQLATMNKDATFSRFFKTTGHRVPLLFGGRLKLENDENPRGNEDEKLETSVFSKELWGKKYEKITCQGENTLNYCRPL